MPFGVKYVGKSAGHPAHALTVSSQNAPESRQTTYAAGYVCHRAKAPNAAYK
jgi:hypothetical protein